MTNNTITGYAVKETGGKLEPYSYDAGTLKIDEVEIAVDYCGLCHSDLSMINNEWGISQYPLIAGHEVIGRIVRMGAGVKGLHEGQLVGVGWTAESCQHCDPCIAGKGNVCGATVGTITHGHTGGFADKVRAQWQWVIPMPEGIDPAKAGPLLCGGITVYRPLLQHNISANSKVGVIGIGGLGHMALGFLKAWGCEVVAFSSNPAKQEEIKQMGATSILNSRDNDELATAIGTFDLIISTVNVKLNWNMYVNLLKPEGKLHMVGVVTEPLDIATAGLISGAKAVAGSPTGSSAELRDMVQFAQRTGVEPIVQEFPLSQINEALAHLHAGKARYRVVLKNDLA